MIHKLYRSKLSLTLFILIIGQSLLLAQGEPDHEMFARAAQWAFIAVVAAILIYGAATIYKLALLFIKIKEDQIRGQLGL